MRQVEPLLSCSQGFVPLNRRFSRHHLRTVAGVTPRSSAASLVLMYSDIDTPNRVGVSEILGGGSLSSIYRQALNMAGNEGARTLIVPAYSEELSPTTIGAHALQWDHMNHVAEPRARACPWLFAVSEGLGCS